MRQSSLGDLVLCLFLKIKIVGFSYVSVFPLAAGNQHLNLCFKLYFAEEQRILQKATYPVSLLQSL